MNDNRIEPFVMDVSLAVIKNLGSKLYSSTVAVLSEIIANAYDGDSESVDIKIDYEEGSINIVDDGNGMTEEIIRNLYLNIGGERRSYFNKNFSENKGRPLMGRKGIGKLSIFAIADNFLVATSDGKKGFTLEFSYNKIIDSIEKNIKYEPKYSIDNHLPKGTSIHIPIAKKRITKVDLLRTKIVRNFPVISVVDDFKIIINEEELQFSHSNQYEQLQFVWKINNQSEIDSCEKKFLEIFNENSELNIKGWIGTVKKPSDLIDSDGEDERSTNNSVKLYINGKIADYNLLDQIQLVEQNYKHYLCGDIHFDDLDLEDVVISNREKVDRENEKVRELIAFITKFIDEKIAKKWSGLRNKYAIKEMEIKHAPIIEWSKNNLRKHDKKIFDKIIASAYTIAGDNKRNERELIEQGLISFQVLKANDLLEDVENWNYEHMDKIFQVLKDFSEVDKIWYYQDAKKKLEIINKLDAITDSKEKEKMVHELVFENLWLVDPSWSNINSISGKSERTFKKTLEDEENYQFFEKQKEWKISNEEDAKIYDSRFDIKVLNNTSQVHTIIELKRPGRLIEGKDKLDEQLFKYNKIAIRHFQKSGFSLVLLVSNVTKNNLPAEVTEYIKNNDVQIVTYEELIQKAQNQYYEYLEISKNNVEFKELFEMLANSETEL